TICAIYREADHWITNTARGAVAKNCPVTEEIRKLCRDSSETVGGGLLAIDIFETEHGLLVNEINHTMEFRNSEEPTGMSISGAIVEYCLRVIKGEAS
ncbi:MAG: lysine biosynthesis protein LysX, partial [Acidobacteriota bacterium]